MMSLCFQKNKIKRKYFQDNFAQSEKNRVKSKWLEIMNQQKQHILFFDLHIWLENNCLFIFVDVH